MTQENRRTVRDERSCWQEAADHGIDMSLIESNLRKSPAERIRAHCRALAAAEKLRKAAKPDHA